MPYEKRPNTGMLFPEKDRPSDRHPTHTGWLLVTEPGLYRIAAWSGHSKDGSPRVTMQAELKDERRDAPASDNPEDQEVPF